MNISGCFADLEKRLKAHVELLAGEIGERNLAHPASYDRAENAIRKIWTESGFTVSEQPIHAPNRVCRNLWVDLPGVLASQKDEILFLGAHYDSVEGSPGANDNASGVALLLELSRSLAASKPKRTIRFAAFANEEAPYFGTSSMGSRVYARQAAACKEKILLMVSLETLGYYSQKPGSQAYPPFLKYFYPDRGNFAAIVGDMASAAWVNRFKNFFKEASDFPVEALSAPRAVPGVDWSDQAPFWDQGYKAVMITDTAPYRYPFYHTPEDTPEKLAYPEFARVGAAIGAVISKIACL